MIWGFGKKKQPEAAAPAPALESPPEAPEARAGLFGKLFEGLRKSSSRLGEGIAGAFIKRRLDQEALDELEELLIASDMGAPAAAKIIAGFKEARFGREASESEIKEALAVEVAKLLKPREAPLDLSGPPRPRVVLLIGVNGSGKTTTIGKLCRQLSEAGAKVVVAAGDTFRAAAIEQLKVWADRAGAGFVSHGQGADAAGVAFEGLQRALAERADVLLIDTAGRLQNKAELMAELAKIVRALRKLDDDAPHETLLVLDATVGQNALSQVESFRSAAPLSGLIMTKLDGTARGGVLVAIAERHALPVHFVGVGEKAEDLQPFQAEAFAKALVGAGG